MYIICNVYYNVCCTPKQRAKNHERKIHCMGEPRLDHLKDLVVHVAIPVETPLELDGVGISQIPFRWCVLQGLMGGQWRTGGTKPEKELLLMEHGSPQVGWDVKQLAMNSRMRSHDVILPTWKSSRISLFSGTVRFVAILLTIRCGYQGWHRDDYWPSQCSVGCKS